LVWEIRRHKPSVTFRETVIYGWAKIAELIDLPFGMVNGLGLRNHA